MSNAWRLIRGVLGAVLLGLIVLAQGCGGGGGSNNAAVAPEATTADEEGKLIIGITDAQGDFVSYADDQLAFFIVVPKLEANWYLQQEGWHAVCLILGAFAMIPILSDYSCRLKAECREARAHRRAFFSVPSHIPPHR